MTIMELKIEDITDILRVELNAARRIIASLTSGERVVKRGTFGDLERDAEIKADRILGEHLRRALEFRGDMNPINLISHKISVEGFNDFKTSDDPPRFWFCVDPLDGSLDYATKGNTLGLPYSTCITVLKISGDVITFNDIVAAGVIDLRSGDLWLSKRVEKKWPAVGSRLKTTLNEECVSTAREKELDLGRMIVIGEMYYPENRERLARAFAGKKGWLRNPGSAAYEMALVSSGQAVAYICDRQKQHELGAAYALVKGAGGVVVDFEGKDLGPRVYDFKTQTPVILAANMKIARQIIRLLRA